MKRVGWTAPFSTVGRRSGAVLSGMTSSIMQRSTDRSETFSPAPGVMFAGSLIAVVLLAGAWAAPIAAHAAESGAKRFRLPAEATELTGQRTITGKHFQLPEGRNEAIISSGALHWPDGQGRLREFDKSFRR